LFQLGEALRLGITVDEAFQITKIDPWFLENLREMVAAEEAVRERDLAALKRIGMSDRRIGALTGKSEEEVRQARLAAGVRPVFKRVDTCAAEFEAKTPYLYSTYEPGDCEVEPTQRRKIV